MEIHKDRHRWSLILAGFFFAAVGLLSVYLHAVSATYFPRDQHQQALAVLYGGMFVILLTGSLGLWLSLIARRETLILRSGQGAALSKADAPMATEAVNDILSPPLGENPSADIPAQNDHHAETVLEKIRRLKQAEEMEAEAGHQNKKITESIQYARRIQSAILPNSRIIDCALPDSFVLYKPRDVVSGDFPWFAQVKNEVFMAAVDCTGHGVPGALLSLVGYFLLNDIVRSRRVTDPGKILDFLDEGVSATLRPDEDAGTKDGMDISLCKINTETREVAYAGAHRPLYIMSDGELREIKGNRFPIGGGIFKNQTSFTTTRIRLTPGDSIFYCTDGFCDQFGGPEGRKFGVRQLREVIANVHHLGMKEAKTVFERQWLDWKGTQKQTDDVLLIGVKF